MSYNPVVYISTVQIGHTPNPFEDQYEDKVLCIAREKLGLPDTNEFQTLCVCKDPTNDEKHWAFGLTTDELIKIHDNGSLESDSYSLKLDPTYQHVNDEFFGQHHAEVSPSIGTPTEHT